MRTNGDIDKRVHRGLDVAMGEDPHRTHTGESAPHLALIRQLALNRLRRETSVQAGIAAKQKRAGWDHTDWLAILAHT
jgi:hypothetical protein